ncbi:MAG: glycoside hydrolase family 127 protein, partial [Porticoccaceae bacterium]|nr:glycoside hydrolase family 127 protein [Porticoccaceae bacterium]
MREYTPVNFSNVKLEGEFWRERLETVLTHTIPSQHRKLVEFNMLDSLTVQHPVPPLTIPRGKDGRTTQIFWDSDIGKWIEAASYALSHRRDGAIEEKINEITIQLEKTQAPSGYLNCWYLQREPENKWTNLRDNHELYNAGHMLEGAVAYFQATGRRRLLDVMEKYVDHIGDTFGTGDNQKPGYPGHQEIELALIKLYGVTKDKKHLDLATYFINQRGIQPHYFDIERDARGESPEAFHHATYEYNQSHVPVREQDKVVGHAVRAMYMYAAMADLASELSDDSLKSACETLWRDITETRMYITGGFGPSDSNEGFTNDYDLPNDTAYAETCASVAMVFWAQRMLNIDLDGQYADILELALYNNSLASLSRDGEHYFYDNKLDSDGTHSRWSWHHCPCCTMNASRLIASVAGYF